MRILLTAVCLFIATVLNAQNLLDFTGTWRVDPSKVQEKSYACKESNRQRAGNTSATTPRAQIHA